MSIALFNIYVYFFRPIFEVCLLLVATYNEHINEFAFTSKCFSHSFRVLPESVDRKAADHKNRQKCDDLELRLTSNSDSRYFSRHQTKLVEKLLPQNSAHVVLSCPLLPDRSVIFSPRTYKLILSWVNVSSSGSFSAESRFCGNVAMTVETMLQQDMRMSLKPNWPVTGIYLSFQPVQPCAVYSNIYCY